MKKDFNSKLKKFSIALEKINVENIILQAVRETEELALDLNKAQLTELSIDSDGKSLGKYKSGDRKGLPIILYRTGEFQDKMFVEAKEIPIFIESKDRKAGILEARWPKALGLTKTFGEQYKEKVMQVYKVKLKRTIENLKEKILQ